MKTITFYSYKGGTGRSLALANAARYLARLQFRVAVIDLDLEAPGLHYKFIGLDSAGFTPRTGLIDYVSEYINQRRPSSIRDYSIDVNVPGSEKPLIHLIPAGAVPSAQYWAMLSQINWHGLFFEKKGFGVNLFLDLKNRIKQELQPDFLLIDSRTGITETGGLATSLLADQLVCLVSPTVENLEGARWVLQSLKHSRRELSLPQLEIVVALSRLPQQDGEGEKEVVQFVKTFLNQEAPVLDNTLACDGIFVLHSESSLQIRESLRVGTETSTEESVLLRDYLRLFSNIVPKAMIEPKLGKIIQHARELLWTDPDAAVKEVEEIAESFGHAEAYRELLRFYIVRNNLGNVALRRAQRLWELSNDSGEELLWTVVRHSFVPESRMRRQKGPNMDFIEQVWRSAGRSDSEFGARLADAYDYEEKPTSTVRILNELVKSVPTPPLKLVIRLINRLITVNYFDEANRIILEFQAVYINDTEFVTAIAQAYLGMPKSYFLSSRLSLLEDGLFKRARPLLAARLALHIGNKDLASDLADDALQEVGSTLNKENLRAAMSVFDALGRGEEFLMKARDSYPAEIIDEIRSERRFRRKEDARGLLPNIYS